MKKFLVALACVSIFLTSGCFKRDEFEDITIYTSNYPIAYITNRLYGDHSTVQSIYPNGVSMNSYDLTEKQLEDYSQGNLFIFNGLLEKEKNYVIQMFNSNKNLKIIDASLSMDYTNDLTEVWLNPSNFLMLAQNIKAGLGEYITNQYLINEINEKYEELKLEVSEIDAKIKLIAESSSNKLLVTSSDAFKFLEKYGITVISLEENENLTEKVINDVTSLINQGKINYIYLRNDEEMNATVKKIVDQTKVQTLTFHSLMTISDEEQNNEQDYIQIMNENIELLKQELYD